MRARLKAAAPAPYHPLEPRSFPAKMEPVQARGQTCVWGGEGDGVDQAGRNAAYLLGGKDPNGAPVLSKSHAHLCQEGFSAGKTGWVTGRANKIC